MKNIKHFEDENYGLNLDLEELKAKAKKAKKREIKLNEKKAYHADKIAKELGEVKFKEKSRKRRLIELDDEETAAYLKAFNL